jgi:maleate cis-trans isomerase
MMEVLGAIEAAIGKAAVNSTQATLWVAMERLRPQFCAVTPNPALGRLFSEAMR